MLTLRPYKPCDAQAIASWVLDKATLRKWSSDRFGDFPITAEDINHKYLDLNGDCPEPDNFYPVTACDENGPVGSLILRYTDPEKRILRLGFVIVDDAKRGRGYGKEMLRLALTYAFQLLGATKVTIGAFENNPSACYCYRSIGFIPVGESTHTVNGEAWRCIEMEMLAPCAG